MTLFEVLLAIALSAMAIAGIVCGYVYSSTSAEKSALSLAANAQACARLEQVRSAVWNVSSSPTVDQLVATNFPNQTVKLDMSGVGQGITYATNYTQITSVSTNPPLKMIRVDCVWLFENGQLMTNTVVTCRSPDQ